MPENIPPELVDNRYFFAGGPHGERIGSYSCGIACVAAVRSIQEHGQDPIAHYEDLLRTFKIFTNNRSVTEFLVKQAVLSKICEDGLYHADIQIPGMETVVFYGRFPEIKIDREVSLYCPQQFHCRGTDALIIHFDDRSRKCYMFPLLITLGPKKDQSDPEAIFFNEWPRWIRDLTGFEIEVQFLRVVESGPSLGVHCEGKPCTSTSGRRFRTPPATGAGRSLSRILARISWTG